MEKVKENVMKIGECYSLQNAVMDLVSSVPTMKGKICAANQPGDWVDQPGGLGGFPPSPLGKHYARILRIMRGIAVNCPNYHVFVVVIRNSFGPTAHSFA